MSNSTPKFVFVRSLDGSDGTTTFFPLAGQGFSTKKQVIISIHVEEIMDGVIYSVQNVKETKSGMYICSKPLQVTDTTGLIFDTYPNAEVEEACKAYRAYLNNAPDEMDDEPEVKATAQKITLLTQLKGDKTLKPPTIEDDGWYVDEELWYYLLRTMHRRKNTLLIGNSGAGKTELAMFLTNKVKKSLEIFDMAVSNPYKTFCGTLQAEDGSTYFKRARFSKAIEEPNVILMDEISRAAPSANNIFLPLLDKRRTLYVEEAMDEAERQIVAHKDCMFWATANIGSEFIGTNMLDHALMNRFQMIEVRYPPKYKEAELLRKVCGLSEHEAMRLADIADMIRTESSLSKDISTRQLIEVGNVMADGYSLETAFEYTVLVQFDGGAGEAGERAKVRSILQA
jgi:nitric oxide reductase NorQ protein